MACFSGVHRLRKTCLWSSVPQNQLHATIQMLDDGRAAIHPVTAIEVMHAIDLLDHGPVNVATNGAVQPLFAGVADNRIFKVEY